jgi:hypothetical protein
MLAPLKLAAPQLIEYLRQQRNERKAAEAENAHRGGRPNPAEFKFLGSMSSRYLSQLDVDALSFTPVESIAELYSLIPKNYSYLGALAAFSENSIGKRAAFFTWGRDYQKLSCLVVPTIEVLVAFLFSKIIPEELEDYFDQNNSSAHLPEKTRPDWSQAFHAIVDVYAAPHQRYYGEYESKAAVLNEAWQKIQSLRGYLENRFFVDDKQAREVLSILECLALHYPSDWCEGLRLLGRAMDLEKYNLFSGPYIQDWKTEVTEVFAWEVCKEAAFHVYQEAKSQKNDD